MSLKSSFVEFAKISQNPYQYRMALKDQGYMLSDKMMTEN
jgi:hypothetical protein